MYTLLLSQYLSTRFSPTDQYISGKSICPTGPTVYIGVIIFNIVLNVTSRQVKLTFVKIIVKKDSCFGIGFQSVSIWGWGLHFYLNYMLFKNWESYVYCLDILLSKPKIVLVCLLYCNDNTNHRTHHN